MGPVAADPLVGLWSGTEGESIDLRDGGVATFAGQPFQWIAGNGLLTLQSPIGAFAFRYQVAGDELALSDGQSTVVLRRSGSTAPAGPRAAPPAVVAPAVAAGGLVGRWTDGHSTIVVGADGILTEKNNRVRWRDEGGNLVLEGPGGTARIPYALDGGRLTVEWSGEKRALVRADGAVGVWVGNETSVDPTILMSYTQYLTLYPDGSVGWSKSELTGTRSEPAPGWERFTSGHSSGGVAGSAGTWSLQGGQLVVRYNNGKAISGTLDGSGNRVVLRGAGVIDEGGNVTFERR